MMRVVQIEPAPMPTFTASTPSSISASVASAVATFPAITSTSANCRRMRSHRVEHALRVAVRRVDDERVDVGRHQRLGALHRVARDAYGRCHPQPSQRVLARVRVLDGFLDVFDGDQPLQPERLIDDQQLLDLVLVQDLPRFLERRPDRNRDQVLPAS